MTQESTETKFHRTECFGDYDPTDEECQNCLDADECGGINGHKRQALPKKLKLLPKFYQFPETPNTNNFFWFQKSLVMSGLWAELPPSAKAAFPVIACHCNKENGKAWPSDLTIGILCGRSEKTVQAGTVDLAGLWLRRFSVEKTTRGKKTYQVDLPKQSTKKDPCFRFFKFILESGMWCELKPTAQALYVGMRCLAKDDFGLYQHLEDEEEEGIDHKDHCGTRLYDTIIATDTPKVVMAHYAGIGYWSIRGALENLEANKLIESIDGGWKVFLKTKDMTYYNREYLNEKVRKSYRWKKRDSKPS